MPQSTYSASTTHTPPKGVYRVMALCWGGGGAGGQRSSGNNSGAAGGRGGGFAARYSMKVTPGTGYTVTVGGAGSDGATPANGGSSTFTADASVQSVANGGASCAANSQSAPATAGTRTGDTSADGGAGGAGGSPSGGGGGAAGLSGVGGDATTSTHGTAGTGGGDGADGRATTGVGATGNTPGGGGAGGRRGTSGSQDGGPGGPGRIVVRWHSPNHHMLLGVGT